ncbi:rifin PIR protein, putative [Plasmodium reichenowi]|uniref:Rifin PIR protein, putative n=1 Tax=Plasmodium reichenowi TaxID=5854 RepID=A0A2P9DSI7_PLARE|nr:rifin PIR protein, putative [Plasmodium reichenowi]
MKVHYVNILLFALPLDILVNIQKNLSTTPHTPKIPTTRLLCECELYAPANYDSDPQMRAVMDNFSKQTQQRFNEYDDRMIEKRKRCKDKCDKEIQKIILKDKLEKQMAEQLTTLETKITTDDIPTCVCKKSMADKVEKGCLRCGGLLGGGVAPSIGLLGGMGTYAWKPAALKAAIEAALKANEAMISAAASAAGMKAGKNAVIESLKELYVDYFWPEMSSSIHKMSHYNKVANLTAVISDAKYKACVNANNGSIIETMCEAYDDKLAAYAADGKFSSLPSEAVPKVLENFAAEAEAAANVKAADVTAAEKLAIETTQKGIIDAASYNWYTTIGYSVLAILIIVIIMVIIYLILRYRRKKKMKKKLQYIKLLEE